MRPQCRVSTPTFPWGIIILFTIALSASVRAADCASPPSGLVSWWQCESNAYDRVGTNAGTWVGAATFAPGRVGQAFSFDGSRYVSIPSATNLSFSGYTPMSLELWVYRTGSAATMHILGKRGGCYWGDLQYQMSFDSAYGLTFIGDLNAPWVSTGQVLPLNTWQHLAVTYDGTNFVFYINGNVATTVAGYLGPTNTAPLEIGNSGDCAPFVGLIDEVSFYNRALAASEVQAIYNAVSAGKCTAVVAPEISTQPADQTVVAGSNATLSVTATGMPTPAYQWLFGGTNLAGATGASLTLINVQSALAGDYSVLLTNSGGSITSDVATLTVVASAPILGSQPMSAAAFPGFAAQLSVAAAGTEPLSCQWQFYGTNLPGVTDAQLTIGNWQSTNAGPYRVIVSNSLGTNTSDEATLAPSPVASWGGSVVGTMPLPIAVTNAVAVSAGAQHSLVLRRDGTVVAWGAADQTDLPPGLADVVAIAAGSDHSMALKGDGTVAAWGTNTAGQTAIPANLSNVVAIAAGASHNLALKAGGTLAAWGLNTSGQSTVPYWLSNNVVAIGAGRNHSLALRADGKVFAWGNNAYGQTNVPANLADVVAIAVGAYHNLALRSDGTVAAWGFSFSGQTNVPAGLSNAIAIGAGGFHSLAVKSDGTLVAWGAGTNGPSGDPTIYPQLGQSFIPPTVTNVVAATGGDAHTLALVADGPPFITAPATASQTGYRGHRLVFRTAATGARPLSYQWQFNGADIPGATGQLLVLDSATNSGNYRVVVTNALGTATNRDCALTLLDSPPSVVSQPVGQSVYLGAQALLQVTADGSGPLYYQWRLNGTNIPGATTSSLSLNHLLASQAGSYSVVISNAFGTVSSAKAAVPVVQTVAWGAGTNYSGSPNAGQSMVPAGLNNAVSIAGGGYHSLAVKSDGGVVAWGAGTNNLGSPPNYGQSMLPASLPAVMGVAGGLYHTLAVRTDGLVAAWGAGTTYSGGPNYGQCLVPAGLSNVVAVAAGDNHSVALKRDGNVSVWGYPSVVTNVPTTATNVIAIASRANHALALRTDGSMVHWGSQNTLPPQPYDYVAIAAGVNHCLGLRSNGTVVSWGGQYPVPSGLSNVVDIAAGYDHSLALRSDGTVVTWGATSYGRNLVPAGLTNVIGIACGLFHSLAVLGDGSPVIKRPPMDCSAYVGAAASFSLQALGAQTLRYQWQFNGTDIPGATDASLTLTNVEATNAGSYRVVVTNMYCSVTSSVAALTVLVPLGDALDAPGLVWSTSGNAAWASESGITHDGVDAAQSGFITDNQSSSVQTTVNGPGTVSFWWKVSSEEWFDYLTFYIDGVQEAVIAGEVDWQQRTFPAGAGSHTLRWTYAKDVSVSAGADAAWLDQVSYIVNPPVITQQPVSQHGTMGATTVLGVAASGAPPLSSQWLKDGTNVNGATDTSFVITDATRRDSGLYQAVVTNPGGSTPSSNATLIVRSPQKLGSPLPGPGGAWALTAGDADGRPLLPSDLANFQVQATTNFVDWVALLNSLTVTNGMLLLVDPDSTNYPYRFYRMIELDDASYVTNPPVASAQPLSQTVPLGAGVMLSVLGLSGPPLRYQWLKDGTNISGATDATLTIPAAARHDSGAYAVVLSNPVGPTLSSNAIVLVRVPEKLSAPQQLADGTFMLTAGDADGSPLWPTDLPGFQAQVSTNVVDWVALPDSLTLTNGLLLLRDSYSTNYPARFYRILEP